MEHALAIAQKIAEADEWARKYRELDQQLTELAPGFRTIWS